MTHTDPDSAVEDFAGDDYDSDYEAKAEAGRGPSNADPYAGMYIQSFKTSIHLIRC